MEKYIAIPQANSISCLGHRSSQFVRSDSVVLINCIGYKLDFLMLYYKIMSYAFSIYWTILMTNFSEYKIQNQKNSLTTDCCLVWEENP